MADGARTQFDDRRIAIGNDRDRTPAPVRLRIQRPRERMNGPDDFDPCLAVDRGMVELDEKREAARDDSGNMVETLDDVGLPQGLGLVE